MSKERYPSITEAIEAGKAGLSNKYGTHPLFYVFRTPKGYGYSKNDLIGRRNARVVQEVPNYFREALEAIIGKKPPMDVPPYGSQPMGDEVTQLQDWCSDNARPPWATGLSMIESAELIVDQALENANIKRT